MSPESPQRTRFSGTRCSICSPCFKRAVHKRSLVDLVQMSGSMMTVNREGCFMNDIIGQERARLSHCSEQWMGDLPKEAKEDEKIQRWVRAGCRSFSVSSVSFGPPALVSLAVPISSECGVCNLVKRKCVLRISITQTPLLLCSGICRSGERPDEDAGCFRRSRDAGILRLRGRSLDRG